MDILNQEKELKILRHVKKYCQLPECLLLFRVDAAWSICWQVPVAPLTKGEFKLRLRVIAVDTSHRSIAGLCRGAEILPIFCSTKCSWSLEAEMKEFCWINIGLNVIMQIPYFREWFPRKLFFFEFGNSRKFKKLLQISIFYLEFLLQKLFKGGNIQGRKLYGEIL